MLLRYTDNVFSEHYISTIGVDFKFSNMEARGKKVKLQIWDTAGQERFRSITRTFYRGAHGVVLVFDITNRESFEAIESVWLKEVQAYADPYATLVLVGNKADMEDARVVDAAEASAYATSRGMTYLEASARNDIGIDETFTSLVDGLVDNLAILGGTTKKPPIRPKAETDGDAGGRGLKCMC
ncbi:Ras family protein [Thecamonas trahens ATCC 50062]|uniref:Ras family protein n=1 Tax=Thecamonas trahens ATCC 50062 TaxID=461836 RepID=A0A0L0DVL0_THETB|nr:Ras family protein [Thecamonas trahens ATCC 50062]KNC56354.1 Ras family protein [Thecamonas trahens ATCC 50062]|eukprot:XP_013760871.1 Ras family protein [Thecamonas trahens ATCC 50062]